MIIKNLTFWYHKCVQVEVPVLPCDVTTKQNTPVTSNLLNKRSFGFYYEINKQSL